MSGPLLGVQALHGGYGNVPIVRGISLTAGEGEIVGMLGHNGMGKTTLLKLIMGYLPTSSGAMTFDDNSLASLPVHRRSLLGLGYVPQGREIFPQLTVRDNLRFAWPGHGDEAQALRRIVCDFPRLEPLLERKGDHLSGGEKQLLAIARCLMADPIMVLLDEPTEGIQPSIIDEISETLLRIRADRGLSILLVEQNFDFLAGLADRVLVLERGEIRAEATGAQANSPDFLAEFSRLGVVRASHSPTGHAPSVQPTPSARAPCASSSSAMPHPTAPASSNLSASANGHAVSPPKNTMTLKRPDLQQMKTITRSLSMSMTDQEIGDYQRVMEPYLQAYDQLNDCSDHLPQVKYPRTGGTRPAVKDNPLNAWQVKCEINGAPAGPLVGRRIVLKDNISLAGVPMMNGASVLEGFVPDFDATVVTRLLDAGATIVGKATCEYLCLSGGSHTSATGAVHNPWKIGYSAGGSSSGCGALVGAGEVDLAIGCDQGGSIRIPSSKCGCYGMKPTHGLVPYSGIVPIEMTLDTVGPITANVADNALLLEVLAGADGLDPRQYAAIAQPYTEALGQSLDGLKIALVSEGFDRPESEPDVDVAVRQAAKLLGEMGAQVNTVSLPGHLQAPVCWTAIAVEGLQDLMMHGNAAGTNYRGLYPTGLMDFFANWRNRADELSQSLKVCMFLGEYFQTYYRGKFYGKAQNISRQLRADYDRLLAEHDLLLMPTLPMKAQPLPPPDAPLELVVRRAFEMVGNTCVFSLLGHPAMNVPCAFSEGLPIGMMLVGGYYNESTIYRAAHAFEQAIDWREG